MGPWRQGWPAPCFPLTQHVRHQGHIRDQGHLWLLLLLTSLEAKVKAIICWPHTTQIQPAVHCNGQPGQYVQQAHLSFWTQCRGPIIILQPWCGCAGLSLTCGSNTFSQFDCTLSRLVVLYQLLQSVKERLIFDLQLVLTTLQSVDVNGLLPVWGVMPIQAESVKTVSLLLEQVVALRIFRMFEL